MTDEIRALTAEEIHNLVKKSIQSVEDGMRTPEQHIRTLEITIGRLVWLCKQPTDTPDTSPTS